VDGWKGASSTINDGAWHHVAVRTNGAAGAFFRDGVADGTFVHVDPSAYTGTKRIGAVSDGSAPFAGTLAEIGVWTEALSDAEIAAQAGGVPPHQVRRAVLAGYWPLWGVASPEPDLSGNANHGTVTGATAADHAPVGPHVLQVPWAFEAASVAAAAAASLPPPPRFRSFQHMVIR
jgi:hypothetical protein